eukprot:11188419-Lingulodinium_polyedra.AAC.1
MGLGNGQRRRGGACLDADGACSAGRGRRRRGRNAGQAELDEGGIVLRMGRHDLEFSRRRKVSEVVST